MKVADVLGPAGYDRARQRLAAAFPDPRAHVSDALLDAFVHQAWADPRISDADIEAAFGAKRPADASKVAGAAPSVAKAPAAAAANVLGYYDANATHTRHDNPLHEFRATLPVARVRLPADRAELATVEGAGIPWAVTRLGLVSSADHTVFTVQGIADKYEHLLHKRPGYMELVTPARRDGARFGAIAVFLGYETASDARPFFYLLEAGMATGEAVTHFLGADIDGPIAPRRSGYKPTPLSSATNFYAGQLFVSGRDPKRLIVHAKRSADGPPYVTVLVHYEATATPRDVWPGLLTAEAASRIGLVSLKRGVPNETVLFAGFGALLPWLDPP